MWLLGSTEGAEFGGLLGCHPFVLCIGHVCPGREEVRAK